MPRPALKPAIIALLAAEPELPYVVAARRLNCSTSTVSYYAWLAGLRRDTRVRIDLAALTALAERGLTMREISEALGVSIPAVFQAARKHRVVIARVYRERAGAISDASPSAHVTITPQLVTPETETVKHCTLTSSV